MINRNEFQPPRCFVSELRLGHLLVMWCSFAKTDWSLMRHLLSYWILTQKLLLTCLVLSFGYIFTIKCWNVDETKKLFTIFSASWMLQIYQIFTFKRFYLFAWGMSKKETCLPGLKAARPLGQNYWTFIYKYYINIFFIILLLVAKFTRKFCCNLNISQSIYSFFKKINFGRRPPS